ncbi:hypothetical protein AJ80_05428 [Polytolypa hystricis UAMH7299]|uniref:4-dimethylallyltryptophan N-methyltransferase n=1 Tax=Polytolypa hystricis (strain UAMH7299) TaxID=1447883 RepID=A0A2B7Y397_POLH7|nr:hypothetical protein AJ80_05428 [Polytolypa hystricis UAMH7299]
MAGLEQQPCHQTENAVIDIGGSQLSEHLQSVVDKHLKKKDNLGRHFLPDIFFSDDTGLQLWQKINRMPDYYQTNDEVELLERYAADVASRIPDNATIIDLGCGDVRKIRPVLDTLEKTGKAVRYYGLDLSHATVTESIELLRANYKHVQCFGLWGTFEDGFEWAKSVSGPRVFLSLGSIYGNDRFDRAVKYLKKCADVLRPEDLILIGIDCHPDPDAVWRSYHDSQGLFEQFIRNGFRFSNEVIGGQWYRDEDWEVRGVLEQNPLQHRFVLRAVRDVDYPPADLHFTTGMEIECYEGIKQTPELMAKQFVLADLTELGKWESPSGYIYEYLVAPVPRKSNL